MNAFIFTESIAGYKNELRNKSSQDFLKYKIMESCLICTVADGHSDSFFTQSDKGAKYACEVAITVMSKYINKDVNEIRNLMNNMVIQKEICNEWEKVIKEDININLPSVFKYNYLKYGTTLLLVFVKSDYILFLKLGDGDILINNNDKIKRILGNFNVMKVDSLVHKNSYKKMKYVILEEVDGISDIIIYSDGYENSFFNYNQMIKNINNTIKKCRESVFSRANLKSKYKFYLENLSRNGSFDDISIIFINL